MRLLSLIQRCQEGDHLLVYLGSAFLLQPVSSAGEGLNMAQSRHLGWQVGQRLRGVSGDHVLFPCEIQRWLGYRRPDKRPEDRRYRVEVAVPVETASKAGARELRDENARSSSVSQDGSVAGRTRWSTKLCPFGK